MNSLTELIRINKAFKAKSSGDGSEYMCQTMAGNCNLLFSYLDFRVCSACYPLESFKIICLTCIWLKFVDTSFHSSRNYLPRRTDIF